MKRSAARQTRPVWRAMLSSLHDLGGQTVTRLPGRYRTVEDLLEALKTERLDGPSICATDVTDYGTLSFVADPFLHATPRKLHCFFEICNPDRDPTAVIGHATSEDEGETWTYNGVVFAPDRHVSFPYVFETEDDVYLLPDLANRAGNLAPARLYRSDPFPQRWVPTVDIVDAEHACLDTVVFEFDGHWWALLGSGDNDELRIYHSETLETGGWTPHQGNPVVEDRPEAGRPGGRPIVRDGRLYVFFQDCQAEYGAALRAFEITELTHSSYADTPLFDDPILGARGSRGWNSGRMHHLDLQVNTDRAIWTVDGDIGIGRNRLSRSMWSITFGSTSMGGGSDAALETPR